MLLPFPCIEVNLHHIHDPFKPKELVMAIQNINELPSTSGVGIDPSMSLNLMYAKLQLMQSSAMKDQAMGLMKEIEKTQQEQKEVAEMISKARELQQRCKDGKGDCSGDDKACYMPQEMITWMNKRGLSITPRRNQRHIAFIADGRAKLLRFLLAVTEVFAPLISRNYKWIIEFHGSILSNFLYHVNAVTVFA